MKISEALNEQMNNEFAVAQTYLSMASYCEYRNYSGFAHFFLQQVEEERFHAMKIYSYLNDRGFRATFHLFQHRKRNLTTWSIRLKSH